jgi:hypothetical protein
MTIEIDFIKQTFEAEDNTNNGNVDSERFF